MPKSTLNFRKYTYVRRGSLNAQIKEVAGQFGDMAGEIIIGAMFYLGTEVKAHTPYRTGRAAGHWQLALNGRPGGYDPLLKEAKGVAIDDSPIQSYKPGDTLYLYNKAPYVFLLEEGWSNQADPGQMLRAQTARFGEFVQRSISDLE